MARRAEDEGGDCFSPLIELTMKSVVGGIIPSHGFDHEPFNGFEDSSFILCRVHFRDEGVERGVSSN